MFLDDRGEGDGVLEQNTDLPLATYDLELAYVLQSLSRLQVLGLAPVPLGEAGHNLERVAARLRDNPVGLTGTLAVGPDLEHLADGDGKGLLKTLHDLLSRSKLDGAPLLDQGVDRPEGVEEDCGGGGPRGGGVGRRLELGDACEEGVEKEFGEVREDLRVFDTGNGDEKAKLRFGDLSRQLPG